MTLPKLSDIKNWNIEIEKDITSKWKNSNPFKFNPSTKKKIYSIDTPPPYINSSIHMGHAVTYSYQDFFARYRRMKGYEVLFPLGLDRNGLPIEMGAEKRFKVSPFVVGREEFVKLCEKLLEETSTESIDIFSKLGISFSSYKEDSEIGSIYLTDSPEYRKLTQSTFIELYKKGLVYEDTRINNWDPKLQTTIADSEIEYEDLPSTFNDIKWNVKETNEEIIIATTRPELICTCGMVIFNPEDKRYKHLKGKTAIAPIFGIEVPIMPNTLADMNKGSGLVMMCSAGDLSDIQFFREQKIVPKIAIGKDGRMNDHAGFLKGLKVREAREKIIDRLKEEKLLVKQEKILHRTPISERSKAEVEFIEMPEYYLKQLEFKEEIRKISSKIKFYPEISRKILDSWIDSINIDWPISRRRFYATPIPLWTFGDYVAVPSQNKYYIPWKESVPQDAEVYKNGKSTKKKVKDFKGLDWKGEERVFDTWMDSSISELYILRYKTDDDFFKRTYPCTLRPQGKEIVRTWLYYTILRGYLETEKPCFNEVWIHQHILDNKGIKMSKSLGNIIDPREILKEYGGEALRLWSALEGDISKQDLRCSKEKINAELKTLNKIINVSKFVAQFDKPVSKPSLDKIDKLFIDYIQELTSYCEKNYEEYDFYNPAIKLRKFLWDVFASNYIEIVKARAYNQEGQFSKEESLSAKYTLYFLLERFLRLIYPIIPQTSYLILENFGIDVLKESFPQIEKFDSTKLGDVQKIMEFNSLVWKSKKDKGLSLRDSLKGISVPSELKDYSRDLIACHNL